MATIPSAVTIKGTVLSEEDLIVEGRVEGNIQVRDARLTIAQEANIEADIHGTHIHILGTVRGTISASERIEMAASARVTGNVSANHVVVVEGAWFKGRIDMNRRMIADLVARHKAKAST